MTQNNRSNEPKWSLVTYLSNITGIITWSGVGYVGYYVVAEIMQIPADFFITLIVICVMYSLLYWGDSGTSPWQVLRSFTNADERDKERYLNNMREEIRAMEEAERRASRD